MTAIRSLDWGLLYLVRAMIPRSDAISERGIRRAILPIMNGRKTNGNAKLKSTTTSFRSLTCALTPLVS
jgi:hypothetical protein